MDLDAIIARFLDEAGNITIPPGFTIPAMTEMLYAAAEQAGQADAVSIRFWDYSDSAEGNSVVYTRREVNTRIKAIAVRLAQVGKPGDRVAILAANSPEYILGFMGAMYAGQVPVPLYDPNEPGHEGHLRAVLYDSGAKTVLTNKKGAAAVRAYFADLPSAQRPRIIAVDALPDTLAQGWGELRAAAEAAGAAGADTANQTAFLQYTSGSTRTPAGVKLTNESIVSNVIQIYSGVGVQQPMRLVSWLPLHHDMGIVVTTLLIILGNEMEIFTPQDFVQQPKRWMERLSRRESDPEDMHIYTVAPNFALDMAARYAAPNGPEAAEDYDFSRLECIIIGSEPVTKPGVDAFFTAFGKSGLRREVLRPSYGLAEATLLVSTPQAGKTTELPRFTSFDREQLAAGTAAEVAEGEGVQFASNGQPVNWMRFAIVDPATKDEVPENSVGEIWVNGPNVAGGYLERKEETADTFANTIGTTLQESLPKDGWLNTGDLGVLVDGELYITGRVKDLVVVAGRNHYPQDIEATVMEASEHVRKDSVAAFSVPGDDVERLVILVERGDTADASGDAAAEEAIRAAVSSHHGVSPDVVEFRAPNEIARSSSGKIARRVNAKQFEERANANPQ